MMRILPSIAVASMLCGCSSGPIVNDGDFRTQNWDSPRVTYEDRNNDGKIDKEYHAYPGADRNWELLDTNFDGRYDKKIYYGYTREVSKIDKPVPDKKPNQAIQ